MMDLAVQNSPRDRAAYGLLDLLAPIGEHLAQESAGLGAATAELNAINEGHGKSDY